MEILGQKYQIYENDELKIFRLVKIDGDIYRLKRGKEIRLLNPKELKDKYIKLAPDASINVIVVKDNVGKNVIVSVIKASDLAKGDNKPNIVIMQDIYSSIKNTTLLATASDKVYVSECYVKEAMNDDSILKELMSYTYDSILDSISAFLYVDDTMNEIIDILNSKMKIINNALKEIKDSRSKLNMNFIGYFDNLKDLLNFNDFITNYRFIFNITQVNFIIDIGDNRNDDGDIILNKKQQKYVEDILRKHITDIKVLKYDKDIDISRIVDKSHIMISDKDGIIYLISYVVTEDYPLDNDIELSMMNLLNRKKGF